MRFYLILLGLLLSSCGSTQLVSSWKNPDTVIFDAYKVLVVGMTPNMETRQAFETRMKNEFTARGMEAVRSIDLFDVAFTDSARSEEELNAVEEQLLEKDFDAILFTKVLGSENRQTFRKKMAELDSYYGRFRDDYLSNQRIYYDLDYYETYRVYHAETSLYCICVGKERELIWRGIIDVSDPADVKTTIDEYVKLLVRAMGEQDILFRTEPGQQATSSR